MSIALDIGVHRLRSLYRRDGHLVGRSCRSVYCVLPDGEAVRRVLDRENLSYALCDDALVVVGDDAIECSERYRVPVLPLLPTDGLPHESPLSRQILGTLVDLLLPPSSDPFGICSVTLPGVSDSYRSATARRLDFLAHFVRQKGYTPANLGAGMAMVLAELAGDGFTGIGMTFGASTCEVSLAHRSIETARCSVPLGGDFVDEELARIANLSANGGDEGQLVVSDLTYWKESFSGSLRHPQTEEETLLATLYRKLIRKIVATIARKLADGSNIRHLPAPLSVVAGGGVARIPGFERLLRDAFDDIPFPVPTKPARVVATSDYTVARGGLIHAELEARILAARSVA